jgi:hypothetical protein
MSGVVPKAAVAPPGPTVRPVFTSSKVSSAPCSWSLLQTGQVAVDRQDYAGIHHYRLDDHAGDLTGILLEQSPDAVDAVERSDLRQ